MSCKGEYSVGISEISPSYVSIYFLITLAKGQGADGIL